MSALGEVLLGRSKFLFFALTPLLLGAAAAITLSADIEDGWHLATLVLCDVAAILLVLSLWPYHRIPGVRRLLMGTVAFVFALYAFDAWLPGLLPEKGASPSRLHATLGLLAIGLPCGKYALLGRFRAVPRPLAIPEDEPLLLRAYEQARATLPRLRSGFAERPMSTLVRVAFTTDEDEVEHLWGRLLELSDTRARLEVLTQPALHGKPLDELTVPLEEIEDWDVDYQDGTLDGGFTTRAMHAYSVRAGIDVPRYVAKRLRRYRNAA